MNYIIEIWAKVKEYLTPYPHSNCYPLVGEFPFMADEIVFGCHTQLETEKA